MTTARKPKAKQPRALTYAHRVRSAAKARGRKSTRNRAREQTLASQGFLPITVAARVVGYAPSSVHRAAAQRGIRMPKFGSRIFIEWNPVRLWSAIPGLPVTALDALVREATS